MKLPGRDRAYVPRRKLFEYLLSETHPIGRTKAAFFRSVGFDQANVGLLERELLEIARNEDVRERVDSPHGDKYAIEGSMPTPVGSVITVRTIWIVEAGDDRPRFVTAYPV